MRDYPGFDFPQNILGPINEYSSFSLMKFQCGAAIKRESGFTLLELILVIVIAITMLGVATPAH